MTGEYFVNDRVREILDKYRVVWSLRHASSLLHWDLEVTMPPEGVHERSIALAELRLLQRKILLENIAPLIEKVGDRESLNDYERGVIRVLERDIDRLRKVPEKLQYELEKLRAEAHPVWVEAKKKSDFESFKPYLERIFSLTRSIAEHIGYDDHPYDPLLDIYEENLRDRIVNSIFSRLVPELKRILEKVLSAGLYPREHELEKIEYSVESMSRVNKEILDLVGYPWSRGRLDVSAHPFSTNIGLKDVRITTRYEGFDFKRAMFSVLHEFGHALYELQIDEKLALTPLAEGVSLGVHESQSRFWENIIGRDYAFVKLVSPVLRSHLSFLKKYSDLDLYFYFNTVKPSLIRVDADEVTYNFHVYLRYYLERLLISGEIKVSDLPELWSNLMEELLGIRPSSHGEGVLQDVHWSSALIGYFPTYTLGNLLAAQVKAKIEADSGKSTSEIISSGRSGFEYLKAYLREKIHRYGSTYPPDVLIARSLGGELDPSYFLRYLEEKYLKPPSL